MAALARYYKSKGLPVAGYDRTESALTDELVAEGITVSYADSMDAVPQEYRDPKIPWWYTPLPFPPRM